MRQLTKSTHSNFSLLHFFDIDPAHRLLGENPDSEDRKIARDVNVPVLTVQWLYDSIIDFRIQPTTPYLIQLD
jgi:hypothetical protein